MPNAASYTVPDNPADPEAAALDLIERPTRRHSAHWLVHRSAARLLFGAAS